MATLESNAKQGAISPDSGKTLSGEAKGRVHMKVGKALYWAFQNIERFLIIVSYGSMTGIIFVEVIRRFLFNEQSAWSTTIPIYLFLWLAWMGASYNTLKRSHLRFTEMRERLSYGAQFGCLILDAVLWFVMGAVVIFFSVEQVYIAYDNFSIVQGTDNVMQWWFYLATPCAWALLLVRVTQNLVSDYHDFKAGRPLAVQAATFGD
ncbi:TRAP transporter small permease [Marinobacterium aestuarii]|nr:TRAP transporter small permease [Marinobacterium aestuarii]